MPNRSTTALGNLLARLMLMLTLAWAVSGCMTVRLVSDYDEQIDRGLSELYAETTTFVDRMIGQAGSPQGTYEANRDFYYDALARIDVLIDRSQANEVMSNCPSSAILRQVANRAGVAQEVKDRLATLGPGGCETVVLRQLRQTFDTGLRAYHAGRGSRGIPPEARGPILDAGLGTLFRTAILIEIAKKSGVR